MIVLKDISDAIKVKENSWLFGREKTQKDKGKNCGSQRNGVVWSRKGGLRAKDGTLVSRTSTATKLGLFKDSGESGIKRVSSDEETSHKQEGGACRMGK